MTLTDLNVPKINAYVKEVTKEMESNDGFYWTNPERRNMIWTEAKRRRIDDQVRLQDAMKHAECTFMPNTQKGRSSSVNESRTMRKSNSVYDPRKTFTNPIFNNGTKFSQNSNHNNSQNNPLSGIKSQGYTRDFMKKQEKKSSDWNYFSREDIEYYHNLCQKNGDPLIDQEDIRLLQRELEHKQLTSNLTNSIRSRRENKSVRKSVEPSPKKKQTFNVPKVSEVIQPIIKNKNAPKATQEEEIQNHYRMHNCKNFTPVDNSQINSKSDIFQDPKHLENEIYCTEQQITMEPAKKFINEFYIDKTIKQKINNRDVNYQYPPSSSSNAYKPRSHSAHRMLNTNRFSGSVLEGLSAVEGERAYNPIEYISMYNVMNSTEKNALLTDVNQQDANNFKKIYPGGFRYHDIGNYDSTEETGYAVVVKKRWKYIPDTGISVFESLYRDGLRKNGERSKSKRRY